MVAFLHLSNRQAPSNTPLAGRMKPIASINPGENLLLSLMSNNQASQSWEIKWIISLWFNSQMLKQKVHSISSKTETFYRTSSLLLLILICNDNKSGNIILDSSKIWDSMPPSVMKIIPLINNEEESRKGSANRPPKSSIRSILSVVPLATHACYTTGMMS
jgi:hypothetical protein